MKSVSPSKIEGTISAPASKSMTVRALVAGLFVDGISTLKNVSSCDDGLAAGRIIEELGAVVEKEQDSTFTIHGTGADPTRLNSAVLHCGESGLAMRMGASIASLYDKTLTLVAAGSLQSRPMDMIDALRQLGIAATTENGHPPVKVKGPLRGGRLMIDASMSSQFLSGLLMVLPLVSQDSVVSVTSLKSSPYVRMTIELLHDFGISIDHDDSLQEFFIAGRQHYNPVAYTIEGDWSGAAFLLVAGAIAGTVTIQGLNMASLQADRAIMTVLADVGAHIVGDAESVTVSRRNLLAFEFDASDCPDLFPPLVSLAAHCEGKTVIHGVNRLANKESNRAAALMKEFGSLGIKVTTRGNTLEVERDRAIGMPAGAVIDSHDDHRIAMAGAITALKADSPVAIIGEKAVNKSYPDFFKDLEKLQVM
jgi:3-phosphoshikimate 1-carboxyvinyltransferase